ncbi:hypothetical protein GCM10010365_40300 [Streptomyces poonensis]|uniref:Uncharacterized protein n=1 Tax=Streptomyces poonensis TaxID=68255 RepID=A0A918UJG3_9ACTN|nr:hypothetical protein GCM10010365_40300 [Streptomyces poonensis]GLJ90868.1 hypothetical protein GCM10017589_34740 [Streptomyces poonensis]
MIFAKEMRSGAVLAALFVFAVEAVREAAKRGPSEGSDSLRAYRPPDRAQEWKSQVKDGSIVGARARACPW